MKWNQWLLGAVYFGALACSPKADQQYFPPFKAVEKVQQDSEEFINPAVDILFVIDDSGSMSVHQQNLSDNIKLFTAAIGASSILDYNIGVITTSTTTAWVPCCGKLVGDIHKIITKNTPQGLQHLESNVMVGITGSGWEAMFDPLHLALTDPLLNGWNKGFLRANATLAVIFVTDAEDQSRSMNPQRMHQFLLGLKGNDTKKVLSYGVIVPSTDRRCTRDPGGLPVLLEEFLGLVSNAGNNIFGLCDMDYGLKLAGMAKDISKRVSSTIFLKRAPDISSIQVSFGSLVLPAELKRGWSYDVSNNAIVLGDEVDLSGQPQGTRLKIFYNPAKFEEEK